MNKLNETESAVFKLSKLYLFQKDLSFHDMCYVCTYSGDNCIQNFHLGRYIVGYTVGNLVLQRRVSRQLL